MKDEEKILENLRKIGLRFDNVEKFSSALRKGIDYSEPKFFSHTMFKKNFKDQSTREFKLEILGIILCLMNDPRMGEMKTGPLKGLRSIELKTVSRGRLVYSYFKRSNTIHLIYVGSHGGLGSKYEVLQKNLGKKLSLFNREGD